MSRDKAAEKHRRTIKRVLTTNYADLANLIEASNPRSVGKELVQSCIVAASSFKSIEHLDDPEKFATRLLEYAMPTLEYDSAKFRTFVELLFQLSQCEKLASKICHEMKEDGYPDYLDLIPPKSSEGVQSDTNSRNGQEAPGSAHSSPGSGIKTGPTSQPTIGLSLGPLSLNSIPIKAVVDSFKQHPWLTSLVIIGISILVAVYMYVNPWAWYK